MVKGNYRLIWSLKGTWLTSTNIHSGRGERVDEKDILYSKTCYIYVYREMYIFQYNVRNCRVSVGISLFLLAAEETWFPIKNAFVDISINKGVTIFQSCWLETRPVVVIGLTPGIYISNYITSWYPIVAQ